MPWKIITLFALIPVAAYWISRYFFYQKTKELNGKIDCRITTQDLAQKISFTGKIPRLRKNKRTALALADVLLDAAYEELKASHKSLVALRRRADAFAQIYSVHQRFLRDYPNAQSLSTGMSADFEVAIDHGATHIRVGSKILGPRQYH